MFKAKSNMRYRDIERREKIIDIVCGVLILPMLYIFIVAVMAI